MRFATNVWGISADGKTDEELALAGIKALEDFINEIGLPKTLRELGIEVKSILPEIAQSCNISAGSYRQLTHEEILDILNECY